MGGGFYCGLQYHLKRPTGTRAGLDQDEGAPGLAAQPLLPPGAEEAHLLGEGERWGGRQAGGLPGAGPEPRKGLEPAALSQGWLPRPLRGCTSPTA